MKPRNFKDSTGRTLSRDKVEELAANNIVASGEGTPGAALDSYLANMNRANLLQWATDEEGAFPEWA